MKLPYMLGGALLSILFIVATLSGDSPEAEPSAQLSGRAAKFDLEQVFLDQSVLSVREELLLRRRCRWALVDEARELYARAEVDAAQIQARQHMLGIAATAAENLSRQTMQDLADLMAQVAAQELKIAELQNELDAANARLQTIKSTHSDHLRIIDGLEDEYSDHERTLKELEAEIAELDRLIDEERPHVGRGDPFKRWINDRAREIRDAHQRVGKDLQNGRDKLNSVEKSIGF